MRMRMRRARRRRDWLQGITPVLASGAWTAAPLSGGSYYLESVLASSQIQADLDGAGTLLRIVGDLYFVMNSGVGGGANPVLISFGIMDVQEDQTGAMSPTMSVLNTTANEFKWLWSKSVLTPVLQNSNSSVIFPAGVHNSSAGATNALTNASAGIDIKCRRKVYTGKPIGLFMDLTRLPAAASITGYGHLRVLCSH